MRVIRNSRDQTAGSTFIRLSFSWATTVLAALAATALAGSTAADDSTKAAPTIFESIQSALEQGQVTKSQQLGFALTKIAFEECPAQGAMLIGFDVGVGKVLNKDQVLSLRPLYRTADKGDIYFGEQGLFPDPQAPAKKTAKPLATQTVQVKAKPDYAVGAITLRTGLNVHGMYVTFMRIKGTALDPSDSYNSNWVGDSKTGQEKTLHGNGAPMVGVFGNKNEHQVLALGVYFANSSAAKEPAPAPPGPPDPPSINPERIPKTASPEPSMLRLGRTDELQGDPLTPPVDLVDRIKLPTTTSTPDAAALTETNSDSADAEEGSGDLILFGLLALVLVAVPVVLLFVVLRNRKAEKPPLRRGLHLEDTNPLDMVRGRGPALPAANAAAITARAGNLPAAHTPHMPSSARAETPTGLARFAATPPENPRLPNAPVHHDDVDLPDLPAVSGIPQLPTPVMPPVATADLPPLPPAAYPSPRTSQPQWGYANGNGHANGHQPDFFEARATCALGKNRSYRVYILPTELLFIEVGSGDATHMTSTGAVLGGLVGALIMSIVASSMKKKSTAVRQQLDLASTEELRQIAGQRQNCFRTSTNELIAARIDAAGFWHRFSYGSSKCAALLHCKFQRRGDYTLELQEAADVQVAIEKLTQILGRGLEVNVVWDGRNKFLRRANQAVPVG